MDNSTIPQVIGASPQVWRNWLLINHNSEKNVWLIIQKKSSKKKSIKMTEAIIEALCFGWIDSRKKGIDENQYMVYFTPRKTNSRWSEANKRVIQMLEGKNKIHPSGQAKIDEAKAHGFW